MSFYARDVIAYIDRKAVEGEWWLRFADRLTPDERKQIGGEGAGCGTYNAIERPLKPDFTEGDWLEVSPRHRIRIAEVRLAKREIYRVTIGEWEDLRVTRAVSLSVRHEEHEAMTIVPVNDWPSNPPEPEGVPLSEIPRYTGSIVARARFEAQMTERRLELDNTPIAERIAAIEAAAQAGAPVGRQLRTIYRELANAERKAGLRREAA